jgi:hypothetical protein
LRSLASSIKEKQNPSNNTETQYLMKTKMKELDNKENNSNPFAKSERSYKKPLSYQLSKRKYDIQLFNPLEPSPPSCDIELFYKK